MTRLVAVGWPDAWRPDWPDRPDGLGWLERSDIECVLPARLEELSFGAPELLWGLALLPLALLAYAVAQRRRGRYAVRFTNVDLLAGLVERKPGPRRHLPPLLYLGSLALLVLGLARPEAPVTVAREEATVVLVMDVSGSMDAQDVAPTRLAAAKVAANTFLDQVPERFRVGIVTFADAAQTILPPTTDHDVVRAALGGLRADGGTAMGDAIVRALEVVPAAPAAPPLTPPPTGIRAAATPAGRPTLPRPPSAPPQPPRPTRRRPSSCCSPTARTPRVRPIRARPRARPGGAASRSSRSPSARRTARSSPATGAATWSASPSRPMRRR